MQVKMMDFLPTFKPRIHHNAETALGVGLAALLQRQARRQCRHAAEQACVLR